MEITSVTENKTDSNSAMKPLKLLAAAALLGAIAGAVAVYVKGGPSVHGGDEVAQVDTGAAQCTLDPALKDRLSKAATGDVAAMVPASPSKQLGALSFNGPDGKAMNINSFSGKTVLVNLWATWCVPCREEMPALNALQTKAGNGTFEVVTVNVDSNTGEKRSAFRKDKGIVALKDYFEPTMALFNAAKKEGLAFGLPVTMLIGPDGCLLAAMNGPANWAGNDALNLIKTVTENAGT
jgi:thiol-disulfide isomerase/thioredoxin